VRGKAAYRVSMAMPFQAMGSLLDVEQRSRNARRRSTSFLEYNIALNAIFIKRTRIDVERAAILFACGNEQCSEKINCVSQWESQSLTQQSPAQLL
jgi:hypothetical protein